MLPLRKYVQREELMQVQAAKHFKVSQPRISDLLRGKISRFSLDTLVNMAVEAGLEVALRIGKPRKRAA